MKQGYEFVVTSTYDRPAYQALSAASYYLFQRHRMAVRTYPALAGMAALILGILLFNWSSFNVPGRVALFAFAALQLLVIPIGAFNGKRKLAKKAVKEAQEKGQFPMQVQFIFDERMIHAVINGETAVSPYEQVDCLMALGPWRMIFYGRAAYILNTGDFASTEEAERFESFLTERCGLPFNQLKGGVPRR